METCQTKEAAAAYLAKCRAHEAARKAKPPEWLRHMEDVADCVPADDRAAFLVPLYNALARACLVDARKLSLELLKQMSAEAGTEADDLLK
jgi:hypothetical protein